MSIFKNIRLGLLHVAVAITFVLINGILNRVMIHDMQILASVVAVLVVLPYLLSPLQVWIGQYSDTHPIMGYRRTPYTALGLLLCIGGAMGTPYVALLMADNFVLGLLLGVLAFGAWGLGFNLAVVAYLSLANDMSTERHRSRTVAIMWFMMIVSVIITAIISSRALEPYSDAQLIYVFRTAVLLVIAASGLLDLQALFVPGVAALGFGTGIATAANLALMLDMTTSEQVGLFIGAWGVADALARGAGMLLGGVVRDLVSGATGNPSSGYITVFLIEAIMLAGSLLLLHAIDVSAFRARQPTLTELVALAGDA